jgi:hypothetical protein
MEGKIPLEQVSGRIDHLGIELKRHGCLSRSSGTTASVICDLSGSIPGPNTSGRARTEAHEMPAPV